jgi:hypothetical protein
MKKTCWIVWILSLFFLWAGFAWAQAGEQAGEKAGEQTGEQVGEKAGGPAGENYTIEVEPRMWNVKLDSTVKIVDNGIGADVNLVNDLGFEERKNFFEGRLQIKFAKKHKFNLEYIPLKWDADKVLTQTIQINGQTYTAGTRVQSSLDLKFFKGGYEYDFLAGGAGFLGMTLDVLVADASTQVKAPDLVPIIDVKENRTVPIPMIGLIGRVYPIKWVNLTAKASGLPAGDYGYVFDAEASLNINPIKYLGISGGYRYFIVDVKYNDNSFYYRLDGPFVGLTLRF